MMSKAKAIKLLFGKTGNQRKLAAELGISEVAVSKWPDDCIPKLRELEVKEILRIRKEKKAKRGKK